MEGRKSDATTALWKLSRQRLVRQLMFGWIAAPHGGVVKANQGLRFAILCLRLPERSPSSTGLLMAIKKSELSSSLWESCDEFAARVDAQRTKMGFHS